MRLVGVEGGALREIPGRCQWYLVTVTGNGTEKSEPLMMAYDGPARWLNVRKFALCGAAFSS